MFYFEDKQKKREPSTSEVVESSEGKGGKRTADAESKLLLKNKTKGRKLNFSIKPKNTNKNTKQQKHNNGVVGKAEVKRTTWKTTIVTIIWQSEKTGLRFFDTQKQASLSFSLLVSSSHSVLYSLPFVFMCFEARDPVLVDLRKATIGSKGITVRKVFRGDGNEEKKGEQKGCVGEGDDETGENSTSACLSSFQVFLETLRIV